MVMDSNSTLWHSGGWVQGGDAIEQGAMTQALDAEAASPGRGCVQPPAGPSGLRPSSATGQLFIVGELLRLFRLLFHQYNEDSSANIIGVFWRLMTTCNVIRMVPATWLTLLMPSAWTLLMTPPMWLQSVLLVQNDQINTNSKVHFDLSCTRKNTHYVILSVWGKI